MRSTHSMTLGIKLLVYYKAPGLYLNINKTQRECNSIHTYNANDTKDISNKCHWLHHRENGKHPDHDTHEMHTDLTQTTTTQRSYKYQAQREGSAYQPAKSSVDIYKRTSQVTQHSLRIQWHLSTWIFVLDTGQNLALPNNKACP